MSEVHGKASTVGSNSPPLYTNTSGSEAEKQDGRYKSSLEEYELAGEDRQPFILTVAEMKLLGIAGVRKIFSTWPLL